MNFFDVLLHPDREELEIGERALVGMAANILQVGEFQVLQLAYMEWFGKDLPEALVGRLFSAYMLRNEVPHWARHYARLILTRAEHGLLDPNAVAYHRYDNDYHLRVPKGVPQFCAAAAILAFILVSSILAAHVMVSNPTSLLPPYFEKHELRSRNAAPGWERSDSIPSSDAAGSDDAEG